MFTAALFMVTKTWKQPKCPSTDQPRKKMQLIHVQYNISQSFKKWNNAI